MRFVFVVMIFSEKLPVEVIWDNTKKIEYLYSATGEKLRKKVTDGSQIATTEYLDGFQYKRSLLEFFPHAEGYVKATLSSANPNNPGYMFNYVFNYLDHLGNIRISYTKDPQTGHLKILDESHYYPFGLKHQEYQISGFVKSEEEVIVPPLAHNPYQYKYNGKEWQDELDLNWYDYGWRNYDPAIGRWMNMDPLAEKIYGITTYNFVSNNPISRIDPDGLTDYKINKETGEISQVGEKNDDPDKILKTDKNGNVKIKGEGFLGFLVRKSERGKEKVAIDGIAKGILEDGMNLKENVGVFKVNGEG